MTMTELLLIAVFVLLGIIIGMVWGIVDFRKSLNRSN